MSIILVAVINIILKLMEKHDCINYINSHFSMCDSQCVKVEANLSLWDEQSIIIIKYMIIPLI